MIEWADIPLQSALVALIAGFALAAACALIGLIVRLFPRSHIHHLGTDVAGCSGNVCEWQNGTGLVTVNGEMWRARSRDDLTPGDQINVTRIDGLTLDVAGAKRTLRRRKIRS